jgi:hypothetical protein
LGLIDAGGSPSRRRVCAMPDRVIGESQNLISFASDFVLLLLIIALCVEPLVEEEREHSRHFRVLSRQRGMPGA